MNHSSGNLCEAVAHVRYSYSLSIYLYIIYYNISLIQNTMLIILPILVIISGWPLPILVPIKFVRGKAQGH